MNDYERGLLLWRIQEERKQRIKNELIKRLCEFLDENEDENGKIDKGIFLIDVIGVETLDGKVITKGLINEVFEE